MKKRGLRRNAPTTQKFFDPAPVSSSLRYYLNKTFNNRDGPNTDEKK